MMPVWKVFTRVPGKGHEMYEGQTCSAVNIEAAMPKQAAEQFVKAWGSYNVTLNTYPNHTKVPYGYLYDLTCDAVPEFHLEIIVRSLANAERVEEIRRQRSINNADAHEMSASW